MKLEGEAPGGTEGMEEEDDVDFGWVPDVFRPSCNKILVQLEKADDGEGGMSAALEEGVSDRL